MKSQIIKQLGQSDILLPSLIAEGLAANDRVKIRLSILQAAAARARDPKRPRANLSNECHSAGIDPIPMESLINRANLLAGEQITAPGLGALGSAIWDDVAAMANAVKAGDATDGDVLLARLAKIRATDWPEPSDTVELTRIAKLINVAGHEGEGDSLHRLVMDLHKALNRLAAGHAEEVVAGAHVFGLAPEDRLAIEAFMRGVESTRKLKFDHPGLATTASRSGNRLVIQNDIGETDAHVLVITVENASVTVTYSDVHRPRTNFFVRRFRDFPVQWSGLDRKSVQGLGDDGTFYLIVGQLTAEAEQRLAFLEAIGRSLVFLIDWNKARKVLRTWVSKDEAIKILDWGADHRVGHRAFLELGGSELVASAVRHAAPSRVGFGEHLDRALGRNAAVDFLKSVLRISKEILTEGGSVRLARDRIEADLLRHLQRVDDALLATIIRQTGLVREIAAALSHFVDERRARRPGNQAALANDARRIEEKADRIAIEARQEIARLNADARIATLVNCVEDAIDDLEQAAFIASLAPAAIGSGLLDALAELCAAVIEGAEAAAIGVAAAADLTDGLRVDAEDAIAAIDRLIAAEHKGDAAERKATAAVLCDDYDFKTAFSALELARALERATDRLAGFGHLLRGYVLSNLSA
jgi:uncharacterized protein Yka (UPF0111/DUF47 family)